VVYAPAGTQYFQYDDRDLVTAIRYRDGTCQYFHHDALMRLYALEEDGATTYFSWDSNGVNPVCEYDASGNRTAEYTHGTSATGGVGTAAAARKVSQGCAYYQYPIYGPKPGNVVGLLDGTGARTAYYEYDAFGRSLQEQEDATVQALGNRLRYQSNWLYLKEGVYHPPARLYHSKYGVFLQEDPLPEGPNPYSYVDNFVTVLVDPTGGPIIWPEELMASAVALGKRIGKRVAGAASDAVKAVKKAAAGVRADLAELNPAGEAERIRQVRDVLDVAMEPVIDVPVCPPLILQNMMREHVYSYLSRYANVIQAQPVSHDMSLWDRACLHLEATYAAQGSLMFEALPIAGALEKALSGRKLSDRDCQVLDLSGLERGGYGALAGLDFLFLLLPAIRGTRMARQMGPAARYQEYATYRSTYTQRGARHLTQRYAGEGHHYIPQAKLNDLVKRVGHNSRLGRLIRSYRDSPLNVQSGRTMARGEFYQHHYQLHAGRALGVKAPPAYRMPGGEVWRASLMKPTPRPYGTAEYLLRSSPHTLRVAGVASFDVLLRLLLEPEQEADHRLRRAGCQCAKEGDQ